MSKAKRMIYIREENVEFYDSLENKSDFINESLKNARIKQEDKPAVEEDSTEPSNSGDLHGSVETMRERDLRILREYREEKGLYDPTKG